MAIRYCGIGGNDGNSGLTWALRKLTLDGVEDTPVVAGDIVYIGPGCYREMLTVDVSGAGGNEIVYIGDVTGEHTDGVGGIVRITGSDNDQTAARNNWIVDNGFDYRTFRGFCFDIADNQGWDFDSADHIIFEDCAIDFPDTTMTFTECTNVTIRRSLLGGQKSGVYCMEFDSVAGQTNAIYLIENCLCVAFGRGLNIDDVGGITCRNSTFIGGNVMRVTDSPPGGYTANTVNNCIFQGCGTVLQAIALGEIVEDYNTFYHNTTDHNTVNVGANSVTHPALFLPPILNAGASQASGFKFPWWFGALSEWSQIQAITGANEPSVDLLGIARPVTASKNSWGSLQFHDMERETGTKHGGSASLVLHDAGRHQTWVPVTNTSTTISVYVYREANYAGNLPQMIVKQPGQADDVTTDVGAAGAWNLLTTTFTPAADPPYVVVELISRNTNGANNRVFFDDLVVN